MGQTYFEEKVSQQKMVAQITTKIDLYEKAFQVERTRIQHFSGRDCE